MATTKQNRIGKTRKRLAALIEEAIPGISLQPEEINSQIPIYASQKWDCCSWYAFGDLNGLTVAISSWDTMSNCVSRGITCTSTGNLEFEVSNNTNPREEQRPIKLRN